MKITISRNTFLKIGFLILINCFSFLALGQKSKREIIKILKTQNVSVNKVNNYIAVLPINGCFNCIKQKEHEINQMKKDTFLIIYPSARKIVQESVKKDFKNKGSRLTFLFDDNLYNQLFDKNNAKGYILKL